MIDNAPPSVKDFAVETFGTNDKPALLIGIVVTLLVHAAVIGALSVRRRIEIGLVGIGVFGLIGVVLMPAEDDMAEEEEAGERPGLGRLRRHPDRQRHGARDRRSPDSVISSGARRRSPTT